MNHQIEFTIAICTYNRVDVLPRALNAALQQPLDSSRFEILVIDNNCTDDTRDIVQDFMNRHSNIRMVTEKNQGLSWSRNRAYNEARGEWIVYVDDDAEICPDYLEHLERIVAEEKKIGALGGPIEVGWLGPVPDWYEPGLDKAFNHLYLGSFRMKLKYPRMIYGTNMVFPVSLLEKLGGFKTDLGRIGDQLLSGEEEELILRIQAREDLPIIYDPMLKVRHLIRPDRLSPEYIMEKAVWQGRSKYRVEKMYPGAVNIKGPFLSLVESHVRKLLGRSSGSLSEQLGRCLARGYLKEWYRTRFKGK